MKLTPLTLTPQNLFGTYPAIATPFSKDGSEIDFNSLKRLIDYLINAKVNGLVVSGSTGEAATLSEGEFEAVVDATVKHVSNRVPVIAGVSANSTKKGISIARTCEELRVDGLLVVLPYYNKPSQDGILAHFKEIKSSTALPIIAYNVPGRTVSNLLPETLAKLADEKIVIGVKEASGNIEQLLQYIRLCADKISILAGEDYIVYSCMTAGGRGVISATANIVPEMFVQITDGCLNGEWGKAKEAQLNLLPVSYTHLTLPTNREV